MIRVDRTELTRKEIIRVAANFFLKDGYTKTTFRAMSQALNMSTGNMTFHFPTKEHMLAQLVDMLCDFQWKMMEEEAKDGIHSVMAICLELLTMASACEQDEVIKDFFLAAYTSPLTMDIIRENDKQRAKKVFGPFCPGWTDEQYAQAETLVSGIEYATLMTTRASAPLEPRIQGALDLILTVYNVPEELRKDKIHKALTMNYRALSLRVLEEFRAYVDNETEQALVKLLDRKKIPESSNGESRTHH